jgi:hypothetical protein
VWIAFFNLDRKKQQFQFLVLILFFIFPSFFYFSKDLGDGRCLTDTPPPHLPSPMGKLKLHLLVDVIFNCNMSQVSVPTSSALEMVQLNQYINIQNRSRNILAASTAHGVITLSSLSFWKLS